MKKAKIYAKWFIYTISAYSADGLKKIKGYIDKTHEKMIYEFAVTDYIGYIGKERK